MLDWFTTIPGILVVCGIILLIIAVILLVAGGKKSKKGANTNSNLQPNMVNNTAQTQNVGVIPNTMTTPEVTATPVMDSTPIPNTMISEPPITPTIPEPNMATPMDANSLATPTTSMNQIDNMPSAPLGVLNQESPMNVEMPTMQPTVSTENVTEPNTIYGGTAPVYNFEMPTEKPVTIYGGNDPLEATQTIPTVEEHHAPYGGEYPEVTIVEPSQEPITPVEEVVSTMPTPTIEESTVSIDQPMNTISTIPITEIPNMQEQPITPTIDSVANIPTLEPQQEQPSQQPVVEEL